MRDVPPRDIRARTAVVLNFSKMKTHPPHPLSRTPDGAQVLRLCFQSANRGKQLHATLVAPDGSGIATIDMSEGSKSLRSSVGEGIKALAQGRNVGDEDAPYPSILVSAVGQEFGSFVGGTRQSGSGAADSGKWSRKDGTGGAVLLEPELDPVCSCFGGGCAVSTAPPLKSPGRRACWARKRSRWWWPLSRRHPVPSRSRTK